MRTEISKISASNHFDLSKPPLLLTSILTHKIKFKSNKTPFQTKLAGRKRDNILLFIFGVNVLMHRARMWPARKQGTNIIFADFNSTTLLSIKIKKLY